LAEARRPILSGASAGPVARSERPAAPAKQAGAPSSETPAPRAAVSKSATVGKMPSAAVAANPPAVPPPPLPPGATLHVAKRGESIRSVARHCLAQTSFLTLKELEAAMQAANRNQQRTVFKAGEPVIIPGMLAAPIVEHPITIPSDTEIHGIYLTGYTAGSEQGLQLIRDWHAAGGNAVVFDLKDYDGLVNVPYKNPLAPTANSRLIPDLPKFAHFLHSLGLHAIGRIACFRDAYQAENHHQFDVRSRATGQPWRENGKLAWLDPSLREVQDYNLGLAKFAVESGVDEIQFDYVRFPAEGDQKDAKFAFQSARPDWQRSDVITDFLDHAHNKLHPLGALVSLDVFGVMAWQRDVDLEHTGQDIPSMARHCEVLSPMIYPSHFFGMDGYARPGDAPEHFITASLDRFKEITQDSRVVIRPWLQAFGWRTRTFSPTYICEQIDLARDNGGTGYLFWNARNEYTVLFRGIQDLRAEPNHVFRVEKVEARAEPAHTSSR